MSKGALSPVGADASTQALWWPYTSAAAQTVPAGGLVCPSARAISGVYTVTRPAADGAYAWVNGPSDVYTGKSGAAAAEGPVDALYDEADGTPAVGETWGAGADSFKLRKNKAGFRVVGTADTTSKTVPVVRASGDVVGPSSATAGADALFDGVTGKLIKQGPTVTTQTTVNGDPQTTVTQYAYPGADPATTPTRITVFTVDNDGMGTPRVTQYTYPNGTSGTTYTVETWTPTQHTVANTIGGVTATETIGSSGGAILATFPSGYNVTFNGTVTFGGTVSGLPSGSGATGELAIWSGANTLDDLTAGSPGSVLVRNASTDVVQWLAALPTGYGGTGQTVWTLGDLGYGAAGNAFAKLTGNTTTTKKFLSQTGTGAASAAPVWGTLASTDISGLGTLATQSGTFSGTHSGTSSGTNTGDQNLFSTIAVSGQSNVVADSTGDTLTLVAGTGITITTNATTDTITITASAVPLADGDYGDVVVSSSGTVFSVESTSGAFASLGIISPTALAANTDNWNPTGLSDASVIRVDLSASVNLTGLAGGTSGRRVTLMNTDGSFNLTLKDRTTSTAANQFYLEKDIRLEPGASAELIYDGTLSKWMVAALNPVSVADGVFQVVNGVMRFFTTVDVAQGGTGIAGYTLGDLLYANATPALAKLAGNTTTTRKFLRQTGTGTVSAAPAWDTVATSDLTGTITSAQLPGGDWITATQSTTTGSFAITGTSGTYQASGISVTLPSAGTFRIDYQVRGEVQPSAAGTHFVSVKLRNTTDSSDLTDSEMMCTLSNQNGVLVTGTSCGFIYVTVAASKTIEIYAKRNGTSWTSSQLLNDANGRTKIGYVMIDS